MHYYAQKPNFISFNYIFHFLFTCYSNPGKYHSIHNRFEILVIITTIVIIYSIYNKYSFYSLGFRKETLKNSLKVNLIYSSFFILLMFLLYYLNLIRNPTIPKWDLFYALYILIYSPSQEFLYRGFLFAILERNNINYHTGKIVFTTITYFLHLIYLDLITIAVALVFGLIWNLIC